MDQLMQSTFPFPTRPLSEIGEDPWAPLADVEDTEDAYVMELELPGAKKDDVTVEVTDGELDIHGEVKDKERKGVLRRQTRRIGRFSYRDPPPERRHGQDHRGPRPWHPHGPRPEGGLGDAPPHRDLGLTVRGPWRRAAARATPCPVRKSPAGGRRTGMRHAGPGRPS